VKVDPGQIAAPWHAVELQLYGMPRGERFRDIRNLVRKHDGVTRCNDYSMLMVSRQASIGGADGPPITLLLF
jgi:hypothetical protein